MSAVLFILHFRGIMDILVEPPSWGVGVLVVTGLYCVWRGHKHH